MNGKYLVMYQNYMDHYAVVEFNSLESAESYVQNELKDLEENVLIVKELYRKFDKLMFADYR